jgi:hypothetical protein
MTTVAHDGWPANLAPRPSWRDAFAAMLLGWVTATVLVIVPVLLAHWLGLVGRTGMIGLGGSGLRDWPYPANGELSLFANAIVWLEIVALTSLLVRGMLADRVGPISAVPIFIALAVTGFVPLLPHGLLHLPLPVAFLASAWLIRVAVATTPIRPLPKRITARLIAVFALLLVIPAWYGLWHPLWLNSVATGDTAGSLTFVIQNKGFADLRVEAVSLRSPAPVEAVGVQLDRKWPSPPGSPFPPSPSPPFTIAGRGDAFVLLHLRHLGCGSGGAFPADAVVRYRLLGSEHVAQVPVTVPVKAC